MAFGRLALPMVHVGRDMAVPPAAAWRVLVDLDRWPEWGPSVADAVLDDRLDDGSGRRLHDGRGRRLHAGATGRVRTAVGVWVPFAVTAYEEGRAWSWRVAGIPATTHTVEPTPLGCRVTFGVPVAAAPYAAVCQVALRRIERLAGQP